MKDPIGKDINKACDDWLKEHGVPPPARFGSFQTRRRGGRVTLQRQRVARLEREAAEIAAELEEAQK